MPVFHCWHTWAVLVSGSESSICPHSSLPPLHRTTHFGGTDTPVYILLGIYAVVYVSERGSDTGDKNPFCGAHKTFTKPSRMIRMRKLPYMECAFTI